MKKFTLLSLILSLVLLQSTYACTNFLITKSASADGSTMITYAADSHALYGALYFWPAKDWPENSMLDIYEWDTGKYLGKIKQVPHTYQVIGNMNEHQLTIGETTYGGLSVLGSQKGAIMDYGSLIYVTLQRAKTAREAIRIMSELVEEYGYASSGESFSIADPNEVWYMELIGKGEGEKGAVWVALKVPDGYISAHANQARITTFDYQRKNKWDDPKAEVFNSKDVISFAKDKNLYDGKDKDFSFSDVYAPVDFGGARFCELRVWAFFKSISKDFRENKSHWNYSIGQIEHPVAYSGEGPIKPENYASNRMPLWIKPDKPVDVHDVMNYMRDHLEGTELDMTKDFGAAPFDLPYRWRPLTWKHDGKAYCNERVTATQQTGFSFVAQCRSWLPDKVGGVFWFGMDDAASTVYAPFYCGISEIPEEYKEGNGSMIEWSDNSAFWIFNMVTNWAYTRYSYIHPEIHDYQQKLEKEYINTVKKIDKKAVAAIKKDEKEGVNIITEYSNNTAKKLVADWKVFFQYLFMKYVDGNMKETEGMKLKDNGSNKGIPKVKFPGYSKDWYDRIVKDHGEQLIMPGGGH